MSLRNEPISQAHLDSAELLKIMQKHNQLSNSQAAELFGVGMSTLLSYRAGLITMSYDVMMRIISKLEPSAHMRIKFMSACQHAVLEAWRNPGTKSSRNALRSADN